MTDRPARSSMGSNGRMRSGRRALREYPTSDRRASVTVACTTVRMAPPLPGLPKGTARARMARMANDAGDELGDNIPTTDDEWRERLTSEQLHTLREAGTERPFTGKYVDCHDDGMYRCAACGAALFSSDTKFESGTGWPSFTEPAVVEAVELRTDTGHGMVRTEVRCKSCGSHLGH